MHSLRHPLLHLKELIFLHTKSELLKDLINHLPHFLFFSSLPHFILVNLAKDSAELAIDGVHFFHKVGRLVREHCSNGF